MVAFPIVLLISVGLNEWYHAIILSLYAICGIARLGYFNIVTADSSKAVKYYEGMPVTFTALIFPVVYLLKLCVEINLLNIGLTIVTALIALLFVIKFKWSKKGVMPLKAYYFMKSSITRK